MADATGRAATQLDLPDLATDADRLAVWALAEDGERDVTTEIAGVGQVEAQGVVQCRAGGVVSGLPYATAVARRAGASIEWEVDEGDRVEAGAVLGRIRGPLAGVLRAERPLLNVLQRACGIATATRAFVDAVHGTRCRVLHTRKTAPGLRGLDVRAVLAGGGHAHRGSLAAAVLLKDNHWRALEAAGGDLAAIVREAHARGLSCAIEVESFEQLERACAAGADRLLVDNEPPDVVRDWASRARRVAPGIEIEASGGITLANVRLYAEAGADYVSVGTLTHSVAAGDLALEITSCQAPEAG